MTYLYLITALFLTYVITCVGSGSFNNITLRFPAIILCVIFTVLTLKGFNFI